MKGACTLVASVVAASSAAVTFNRRAEKSKSGNSAGVSPEEEERKYSPRFDGLRFIETLVTAHR